MNLDDLELFQKLDCQNIYQQIETIPEQLKLAYQAGSRLPLPEYPGLRQVVFCGMGFSALSAELVAAYASDRSRLPLWVHRDQDLPAWARGPETLVIGISLSGNTDETLSAVEQAVDQGCACLAVTTGGRLAGLAATHNFPTWNMELLSPAGSGLAAPFGYLLAVITRLGLIADPGLEFAKTIELLVKQQRAVAKEIPAAYNPAKRMAGQCIGRWVTVVAAGPLAPTARSWAIQISKLAKAGAQSEQILEVSHNLLAGVEQPEDLRSQTLAIFLSGPCDSPRHRLAGDLLRQFFMLQGLPTDSFAALGESALANMWTCLQFGDYAAYYLAMAYGVDPFAEPLYEAFKDEMKRNSIRE